MELIILGSGTAIPTTRRSSPGLLIRVAGESLLFDGGSGTLKRLAEAGVDIREIDRVFYTHLHPDHTADLVPFLFALKNPDYKRAKALYLSGPPGFNGFYRHLIGIYGESIVPMDYSLHLKDLKDETWALEGWSITAKSVIHTRQSLAYRIESGGKAIVYSGDTDYCQAIIDLAMGSDLLVLECAFPNERRSPGHLTPSLAGEIASKARCQRLVLTHFYPVCEGYDLLSQCRKTYSGEVTLAEDLMRVTV